MFSTNTTSVQGEFHAYFQFMIHLTCRLKIKIVLEALKARFFGSKAKRKKKTKSEKKTTPVIESISWALQLVCTLSAHLGPLTAAEFCPWDEEILATTSEDRSFKVLIKQTLTILKTANSR